MPQTVNSDRRPLSATGQASVAAFLVTRGKTPYFYQTLNAIKESRYPIASVIVVDVSAEDDPLTLSHEDLTGFGPIQFTKTPGAPNLGAAVRTARAQRLEPVKYLWLLHDDSAPDRSCLGELVHCFETSTTVACVGPKQLDWNHPDRIVSAGIKATRVGRRLQIIEPGEIDQGQYDHISDVLAVDTAGMLVETKIWDRLQGTNPILGPFGDGLEWGRRLHLAGYRVCLAPEARLYHAQASYFGFRPGGNESRNEDGQDLTGQATPTDTGTDSPRTPGSQQTAGTGAASSPTQNAGADRAVREELAARTEPEPGPVRATRAKVSEDPTLQSMGGRIITHPAEGADGWDSQVDGPRPHQPVYTYEAVPVTAVKAERAVNLSRSFAARRRAEYINRALAGRRGLFLFTLLFLQFMAWGKALGFMVTKNMLAARAEMAAIHYIWGHLHQVRVGRKRIRWADVTGRASLRPLEAKRAEIRQHRRLQRRVRRDLAKRQYVLGMEAYRKLVQRQRAGRVAIFTLLLVLAIASIFAGRTYFGGIHGAFWNVLPESWLDLWQLATNDWRTGGLGQSGAPDPILFPVTLLTGLPAIFGVTPTQTMTAVLVTSPLWAGLFAWLAAGAVSRQNGVRIWLSLSWACGLPLLAGIWAGNLSAVLVHLCLPLLAWGIICHFGLGEPYRLNGVVGLEAYSPPRLEWCGGGVAALALIVVSAGAPWLWCVAVAGILLAWIVAAFLRKDLSRARRFKRGLTGLAIALPSLAVLLPSLVETVEKKQSGLGVVRAFLLQTPQSAAPVSFTQQLFSGAWTLAGRWALYVALANLVVIALAGLAGLIRSRLVLGNRVAALVALGGLVVAYVAEQKTVATIGGAEQEAWPGIALSLSLLGGLALGALGLGNWHRNLLHHRLNSVAVGLAVILGLGSFGTWMVANEQLVSRTSQQTVAASTTSGSRLSASAISRGSYRTPDAFDVLSQSTQRSRVLVLDRRDDGSYQLHLWRFAGPSLLDTNALQRAQAKIEAERVIPAVTLDDLKSPTETQLAIVAALAGGDTGRAATLMAQIDAGQLLIQNPDQDAQMAATLQSTSDFNLVKEGTGYTVWRLNSSDYLAGRMVRVNDTGQQTLIPAQVLGARTQISSDPVISDLRLAESYDNNWHAWIGTQELAAENKSGQQVFEIGENVTGELLVRYDTPLRWLWLGSTSFLTICAALAALPLSRKREG